MRSHTRPGRFLLLPLSLAGALALAGCGGGDGDGGTATTSPSATSEPTGGGGVLYTPEELSAALLTTDALGPGWTETQRSVFTVREPENPSVEESISLCPEAADQADALGDLASDAGADVEMEQAMEGGTFHMLRQQAWSDENVQAYVETLAEAVDICAGTTWTDADGNEVTFEALEAPEVGDESTSMGAVAVIAGADGDTAWRVRLTVARFGTALMAVGDNLVEPADTPAQETDPSWETIVTTAAAPFAELDAG